MSLAKDYSKIDSILYDVSCKLSSIPCMPENIKDERDKFFKSKSYNPQFQYGKKNLHELSRVKDYLQRITFGTDVVGVILQEKRDELVKIIDLMSSIGTSSFTIMSRRLYGIPNPDLVRHAAHAVHFTDAPENIYLSTQQVSIWLEHTIAKYGFEWKIKEKDMASRACVNLKEKVLYIKKDCFFSYKFLNRLIVHEIGTHILRYECGINQPYKIFSLGLAGYLATEEGLAVVNEEQHNCLTKSSLKTYAARVLGVNKALKCSFRETFDYLEPLIGKENAFEITLRVKRGLGNTSLPGAFTKDYLYLHGYFEVKRYLATGGSLQRLYFGKFGVKDITKVESIKGIVNPLFVPKMKYYVDYVNNIS